jgi:hypothetical protein
MKISLNERKFLIILSLINMFALFVNLAKVNGKFTTASGYDKNEHQYLWTSGSNKDDFWPFISFVEEESSTTYDHNSDIFGTNHYYQFQGIFNSYGIEEFIGYSLLGLLIIVVPKLMKTQKTGE